MCRCLYKITCTYFCKPFLLFLLLYICKIIRVITTNIYKTHTYIHLYNATFHILYSICNFVFNLMFFMILVTFHNKVLFVNINAR